MTRRRVLYAVLWLALALAVLVIVIVQHFAALILAVAALAWLGGIVTERLRVDLATIHPARGGEIPPRIPEQRTPHA